MSELWARPVVYLNPERGEPKATDSHIGGPLRWPDGEPWPHCDGSNHATGFDVEEDTRGLRVPLTIALQLYRRDFPELPFPDGTDVLQVLMCSLYHDHDTYGADARLFWRDSATLTVDPEVPEPAVFEPGLRAEPCLLKPTRGVEHPEHQEVPEGAPSTDYKVTQATKIGGYTFWYASGPDDMTCVDCGARRVLLLSLNSGDPVGWEFSGDCVFNVQVCEKDVRHRIRLHVD